MGGWKRESSALYVSEKVGEKLCMDTGNVGLALEVCNPPMWGFFFFFLKHQFRWSTGDPAFVPVPPSSARQPSWPAHSTSPASCPRLQNLAGQGGEETHRVSFTPQGHQARNPGKKVNLSPIKRSVLKNTFYPSLSF